MTFLESFPAPPASRRHHAWHSRGYLPHFDSGAVLQAITFRLAHSLPRAVFEKVLAKIGGNQFGGIRSIP